jgi:hypothetical protein
MNSWYSKRSSSDPLLFDVNINRLRYLIIITIENGLNVEFIYQ